MKRLFILLFSMVMAGEMTVDGNLIVADTLHVTTIKSATNVVFIDSLLSLIAQLEQRIAQLECQNTEIIPDGYCDCFFHTLDECNECNGDNSSCSDECGIPNGDNSSCSDCAGVPNGESLEDMCGYCDNDSSNDCVQDCFGEWGGTAEYDACGECGGDVISEDECIFVYDYDGNVYTAVEIGNQVWLAENLKVTKFSNSDEIALSSPGAGSFDEPQYAQYGSVEVYGLLYNFAAVKDDRGLCMEGWHVPSDDEWKTLESVLGMSESDQNQLGWERGTDEGGKLKESGTEHWLSPNTSATNETGFTALGSGYRNFSGAFYGLKDNIHIYDSDGGHRRLNYDNGKIFRQDSTDERYCFAVRCVQN